MADTVKANQGAVSSLADTDLVMCVASGGYYRPVSFADLAKLVRGSIHIGGRNLIKNSDVPISGPYGVGTYQLSEPMESGKRYVMTLYGVTIGNGKQDAVQVWNQGGLAQLFICRKVSEGIYRGEFTPLPAHDPARLGVLNIHVMPSTVSTISTITLAKLEEGNIATAWSPAPEDIASGLWGGG